MKGKGIQLDGDFGLSVKVRRDTEGKIIGGLVIGDTLRQNQALILSFYPGELKLSPLVGVGLSDMVNDNDILAWKRTIRQQLELDGQRVNDIRFTKQNQLIVDAEYNS
jgi:hypothetical protein